MALAIPSFSSANNAIHCLVYTNNIYAIPLTRKHSETGCFADGVSSSVILGLSSAAIGRLDTRDRNVRNFEMSNNKNKLSMSPADALKTPCSLLIATPMVACGNQDSRKRRIQTGFCQSRRAYVELSASVTQVSAQRALTV